VPTSRRSCWPSSAGWPDPPSSLPERRGCTGAILAGVGQRAPTLVIVGGNLTGGAAASTLRTEGFDGGVLLVGQEPHLPYERPPLSKGYLRGEEPAEQAFLRPLGWYQENEVELRLGVTATGLDPANHQVELSDGDRIGYDKLLVATGGRNRRLEVPGANLEGIHQLRTLEDADRIKAESVPGRRAVVVGAGFIGCEVAASLRQLGVEVEVVEILGVPLERVLGAEVGRVFEGIHRDAGVRFHLQQSVDQFEGHGRVESVVTSAGHRIECDFAVVGVGIQPNVEWLARSGVELDNGVVVDEFCRTSEEGVYAAGDLANHWHPIFRRRMRVEHWDNALKQGAAAARNMMGKDMPFDDPHWFWSDQYEHNLQSIGFAPEWDDLVVRGSKDERSFVAFYVKEGLVRAAVGLNRGKDVRRSAGLVRAGRPVATPLLRDEDVDLKKLIAELAPEGA
jgi:3-phenylpropionate/trans-cinnamate dioxygenase ferredoxin reductase subunit